jgi:hypothetical protein
MNLKKVFPELTLQDVQEMLTIDLDGDRERPSFHQVKPRQKGETGFPTPVPRGPEQPLT